MDEDFVMYIKKRVNNSPKNPFEKNKLQIYLRGKADEVGVVGVHVGELVADHHLDVILAPVLRVAQMALDNAVHFLAQPVL